MHSIAREHLQSYLYAYKESSKEPGLGLIVDGRARHTRQMENEERRALASLKEIVNYPVAFAVKAHLEYDGSLEDESPFYRKTVSFKKDDFIHIYQRYNRDWWLGRVVSHGTTIGFVPTARRLVRLLTAEKEERGSGFWEMPRPFTVVPSTRPIVLLGPSLQSCRLTMLMHAAIRAALVDHFGPRLRRLSTDIGRKDDKDAGEREQFVITSLAQRLHLVLLESPNVHSPQDLQSFDLAPIYILFRVSHRKVLIKLLKKSGCKTNADLQAADFLSSIQPDTVDMVIDENGLGEATRRICNYLEEYWLALHPTAPLMEEVYLQ